jgi:hypothetical protein
MNIWILYYSNLFLHTWILYNFIFLIIFFFCSKDFLKNIFNYYRWIYRRTQSVSIFQKVWNNLLHMPLQHCYITDEIFRRYFIKGWNKITINVTTNHWQNDFVGILKRVIFFWHAFSVYKTISVFFIDKNADRHEITNKTFTERRFSSMNLSVKFLLTKW